MTCQQAIILVMGPPAAGKSFLLSTLRDPTHELVVMKADDDIERRSQSTPRMAGR
jgi:ribose 1,5-bisphosphokinase PhnN